MAAGLQAPPTDDDDDDDEDDEDDVDDDDDVRFPPGENHRVPRRIE